MLNGYEKLLWSVLETAGSDLCLAACSCGSCVTVRHGLHDGCQCKNEQEVRDHKETNMGQRLAGTPLAGEAVVSLCWVGGCPAAGQAAAGRATRRHGGSRPGAVGRSACQQTRWLPAGRLAPRSRSIRHRLGCSCVCMYAIDVGA